MLASGDFVTPRLNGVPYLEKPPLLYWANAASLRLFGLTPWAARLPTRPLRARYDPDAPLRDGRGLGDAVGARGGDPVSRGAARLRLLAREPDRRPSDVLLHADALSSARATLARYEARLRWKALAALTGLAAAGGFLSKGLVAIVLPGAILFLWCLATRRMRFLTSLLFGPALPVFLLAAAPWFVLAERRTPGFLQFFFIHEHFQRFSTSVAQRPGPIYYFVLIFLAGFLPVIPFFLSSLKKAWRRDEPEALFFLLWFTVVLVFFSLSRSKLPPYLMPAFPAAAALAARALFDRQPAGQELALLGDPRDASARLCDRESDGSRLGRRLRPRSHRRRRFRRPPRRRLVRAGNRKAKRVARCSEAFAAGWTGFAVMAALSGRRAPPATDPHAICAAAAAARNAGATVVGYKAYLQGLPLALESPVPLTAPPSESWSPSSSAAEVRESLFWTRKNSGRSGKAATITPLSFAAGTCRVRSLGRARESPRAQPEARPPRQLQGIGFRERCQGECR